MGIIKQISVYNSSSNSWGNPHDLSAGSTAVYMTNDRSVWGSNIQSVINKLLRADSTLGSNKVVVTDSNGRLQASTLTASQVSAVTEKVSISGDTMTGMLTNKADFTRKDERYTVGNTAPSTNYYTSGLRITDSTGTLFGNFGAQYSTGNVFYSRMNTTRAGVNNYLQLGIDKNGNRSVAVSDPQPWRKALQVASTADLLLPSSNRSFLTDNLLQIQAPLKTTDNKVKNRFSLQIINDNITVGRTNGHTSDNNAIYGQEIQITDNANKGYASYRTGQQDGVLTAGFYVRNRANTTTTTWYDTNYLYLGQNTSGTNSVRVAAPAAWRTALGAASTATATSSANGLMSSSDKNNLTTYQNGNATANTTYLSTNTEGTLSLCRWYRRGFYVVVSCHNIKITSAATASSQTARTFFTGLPNTGIGSIYAMLTPVGSPSAGYSGLRLRVAPGTNSASLQLVQSGNLSTSVTYEGSFVYLIA